MTTTNHHHSNRPPPIPLLCLAINCSPSPAPLLTSASRSAVASKSNTSWAYASSPSSESPMPSPNLGKNPTLPPSTNTPHARPALIPPTRSVFQTPWARILGAVERIAGSHHQFADSIERDVELPLRGFTNRSDVHNVTTVAANLTSVGKELEDARDKADRLNKKAGKTSAQKMDAASAKLESVQQEWESQAPFVFETLQALDESRVNQLRDVLTQYQTHETDQAQRTQAIAAETLAVTIEIETESEIRGFVHGVVGDRPPAPTRSSTRRSSIGVPASTNSTAAAAQTPTAAAAAAADPATPSAVTRENTMNALTPTASAHQSIPEEDGFDPSPAPQKGTPSN